MKSISNQQQMVHEKQLKIQWQGSEHKLTCLTKKKLPVTIKIASMSNHVRDDEAKTNKMKCRTHATQAGGNVTAQC